MKNESNFHKTIGILVNAFLNNTLYSNSCYACGVGNIVAAANGYTVFGSKDDGFQWRKGEEIMCDFPEWTDSVWPYSPRFKDSPTRPTRESISEIKPTGYSAEELAMIEDGFMNGWQSVLTSEEDSMYAALMATVDILAGIHEADLSAAEQAKSLFVK